jgi:hypothetical protein
MLNIITAAGTPATTYGNNGSLTPRMWPSRKVDANNIAKIANGIPANINQCPAGPIPYGYLTLMLPNEKS